MLLLWTCCSLQVGEIFCYQEYQRCIPTFGSFLYVGLLQDMDKVSILLKYKFTCVS